MKKIIILFIMICSVTFGFRMQPTYYDQRIDGDGGYAEINYKNTGTEPLRYKFVLYPGEKNDMSKWVEVYPKVLNIPPKSTGKLKIYAKAPNGTKAGEYNFSLYAKPIVIPTIKKGEKENKVTINATTVISMTVGLSGYVGDPELSKNLIIKKMDLKKDGKKTIFNGRIKNDSYRGISLGLRTLNSNGVIRSEDEIGRVSANNELEVKEFVLSTREVSNDIETIVLYDMISRKDILNVSVKK